MVFGQIQHGARVVIPAWQLAHGLVRKSNIAQMAPSQSLAALPGDQRVRPCSPRSLEILQLQSVSTLLFATFLVGLHY